MVGRFVHTSPLIIDRDATLLTLESSFIEQTHRRQLNIKFERLCCLVLFWSDCEFA